MPNDSFAENPAMEPHAAAVSTGAQGLLAIARKRDPSGALALNAALGLSLQAVAELPRLCAAPGEALNALIGEDRLPETFFAFRAAFANAIDARAAQQPNSAPDLRDLPSSPPRPSCDFDHDALMDSSARTQSPGRE